MAWYWWVLIIPVGIFVVLWVIILLFWLAGYVMERGKDQYHKRQEELESKKEVVDSGEDGDDNGIHPMNRSPYESDK